MSDSVVNAVPNVTPSAPVSGRGCAALAFSIEYGMPSSGLVSDRAMHADCGGSVQQVLAHPEARVSVDNHIRRNCVLFGRLQ